MNLSAVIAFAVWLAIYLWSRYVSLASVIAAVVFPAALGAGGGNTVLSWTVVNEDALSLEPGIGTITGYTSANLSLSVTTTYTLTASNSLGLVSSHLTVDVGP